MKCYLVSFDAPSVQDLKGLVNAIKAFGTWARIHTSLYAVVTDKKATQVRDELGKFVGPDGRFFVIRSGIESAWRNAEATNDWMKKYIPLVETKEVSS